MAEDCRCTETSERLSVVSTRLDAVESDVSAKVSIDRFAPVEKVVYGLVACVLMAVLIAVINNVVAPKPAQTIPLPPPATAPGGAHQ